MSQIYGPVVYGWARRAGLQPDDATDIGQEVFRTVAARLNDFDQDRPQASFRGWLWGVTRNKLREWTRRRAANPAGQGGTTANVQLHAIEEVPDEESAEYRSVDSRTNLLHRALDQIRLEFEPKTWQAFWKTTIDLQRAADVAETLSMTPKAVRQAKYRVLRRLRQEMTQLD